ncbi:RelA/SpoT domain-containing protein [Pontibacterium sp. N1Y112]|uniref:RelA/SpoT domain-containing protein n=1 Tax=Pontibacterium sinense TaxID=2781979 RepID=A0A8J7FWQ5_9GAMM|nr:RelA/SpoT domain-containing protein [Pontibacterium sinense]MBE9399000.1 RelA/SpoT domain-containing protein [Pontibacterium sinense]
MAWMKPRFSKKKVSKAGSILKAEDNTHPEYEWAIDVLTNWRSIHGYPINTFQSTLRDKLYKIDRDALVAQRLKRSPSVISKLQRFDSMQLHRMNDIAGIRAVVKNLTKVRELEKSYKNGRLKHELVSEKDYIENPKDTGYRGIHLVYRYKNDKAPDYDGLHVELQIRTRLQHAWATAVETMGTFLNQALKSSEGPDEWLSFFALAGSAIAHLEESSPVPGYESLDKIATFKQVLQACDTLDVENRLDAFSVAAESIHKDHQAGNYHLITLDLEEKLVYINSYGRRKLGEANEEYAKIERDIANGKPFQVVLVAAGPIESLRKAYPNYFLDTHEFLKQIKRMRRSVEKDASKKKQADV